MFRKQIGRAASAIALAASAFLMSPAAEAANKPKIYFSMGFIGNNWMTEARNMISALAASPEYKDKIDFEIQAAGGNPQRQIQQINGMIQAGAKAIIIYPISEPTLKNVVESGCKAGVQFFVFNGAPAPCAHALKPETVNIGRARTDWMAKTLNGKGRVVVFTGIPGTTFSDEVQKGVDEGLKANPGLQVVATLNGEWSQQATRLRMQELLATKSWNDIDGVIAQEACFTIMNMQLEAGISKDKLKPCAGQDENGFRLMMLPAGNTNTSIGAPGFSTDSGIWMVPYALKLAVEKLEGKDVPKVFPIKPATVSNENVKICVTGSTAELKQGCNTFQPKAVPDDWQAGFWNPDLPELDLQAVLTGKPST